MHSGRMIEGLQGTVAQLERSMRLCWTARVDYTAIGNFRSRCAARVYSDGMRAVVILTELKDNPGTSVTNAYEHIAAHMRAPVINFIPPENFPSKVTWLEQYESHGPELDLVEPGNMMTPRRSGTSWRRLKRADVEALGLEYDEASRQP